MRFLGRAAQPEVIAVGLVPRKSHYFIGRDPRKWRSDVSHYSRILYSDLYPGINVVYYGVGGHLRYDFVVHPGANPEQIRLQVEGAEELFIGQDGTLVLSTTFGELRQTDLTVYQEVAGKRQTVEGSFQIIAENQVTFRVPNYNRQLPLVVDPVLEFATFVGLGVDEGNAVAVDGEGNVYLAGMASSNFSTINGNVGDTFSHNLYVTKMDPTGSTIFYSSVLGGERTDRAFGIAVDDVGCAYLTGFTDSNQFPVTAGAIQVRYAGPPPPEENATGGGDGFIVKICKEGTTLEYATYLGGRNNDFGWDIAVDSDGQAHVTGPTWSDDFPTTEGALQNEFGGDVALFRSDTFVSKVDIHGTDLVYSTYMGNERSEGRGIAVDASGNAYVTGKADLNFLRTPNALSTEGGLSDPFVAKFDPTGTVIYSAVFGGKFNDLGTDIAVDKTGSAYVVGETNSPDFPATDGAFQRALADAPPSFDPDSATDAFVAKLNAEGSDLVFATYLGGNKFDGSAAIGLDSAGHAFIAGISISTDFPLTDDAFQRTFAGRGDGFGFIRRRNGDLFIAHIDGERGDLLFSSYLGGKFDEGSFVHVAVDDLGSAYVVSSTISPDFPVTPGSLDDTFSFTEGVVAKISSDTLPVHGASFSRGPVAPESWVTLFGTHFADGFLRADFLPLPTTLGGVSVMVRDSAGDEHLARLHVVSPNQINLILPADVAAGPAALIVHLASGERVTTGAFVQPVSPGIFTANGDGRGVPAAFAITIHPDGSFEEVPVFQTGPEGDQITVPIDLGEPDDIVAVSLFGTGIRGVGDLSEVHAWVGGDPVEVVFAG